MLGFLRSLRSKKQSDTIHLHERLRILLNLVGVGDDIYFPDHVLHDLKEYEQHVHEQKKLIQRLLNGLDRSFTMQDIEHALSSHLGFIVFVRSILRACSRSVFYTRDNQPRYLNISMQLGILDRQAIRARYFQLSDIFETVTQDPMYLVKLLREGDFHQGNIYYGIVPSLITALNQLSIASIDRRLRPILAGCTLNSSFLSYVNDVCKHLTEEAPEEHLENPYDE